MTFQGQAATTTVALTPKIAGGLTKAPGFFYHRSVTERVNVAQHAACGGTRDGEETAGPHRGEDYCPHRDLWETLPLHASACTWLHDDLSAG